MPALPPASRGDGAASAAPRLSIAPPPASVSLIVGYPAADAARIVDRLLAAGGPTVAAVVAPAHWHEAQRLRADAQADGRLRLYPGSADAPGLGLPHTAWRLLDTAIELYAVASPEALATGHVQDFADECPHLRRVHLFPASSDTRSRRWPRVRPAHAFRAAQAAARLSLRVAAGVVRAGASAVGAARAAALGLSAWTDGLGLDFDAALSGEEIERDLWPGLPHAT